MHILSEDLAQMALTLFHDRDDWTYCQGGLGELAESKRIESLYKYYYSLPNRSPYMVRPYDEWIKSYKGRHCTDCNNLINMLLGYKDNHYSCWHFTKMPAWTGPIEEAPQGAALLIVDDKGGCGHVGIATGRGEFVDIPHYEDTIRKGLIKGSLWNKAVLIPDVVYPYDSYKASLLKNKWTVGDMILKSDIALYGSIGGCWIPIPNFDYTPTRVTNTVCQVAVTYADFVGYLGINAASAGRFYAVMVPATDADDALRKQKAIMDLGYSDAACVRI